ncbi:type I-E CRISPR-associated protein Cas7/Cse4/CasC [Solwaraspora sp. WMMD406]|uniref:type I-E CRISPR-associated protein Cas7/Cse4/CasC n=1 Tax=Solwaraspora sp. WMMD406 TaxID=3016095 RepID=UPI0024171CC4|nr:type I-E CRISPR-associated protein Cas7/Cse4/CasC [Solwaraspora sp. WMMD406]MDG4768626.1 type I-E CRISPR-associated protein Cas7/Cse4/CasC [Solwaraspora sp. WMMD406]
MTARYVEIHLLQTVPYANLNRDDLGSPKTVRFGYAERTRVSSQCWKRAVREELEASSGDAAKRTRRLPQAVQTRLTDRGWEPELATYAAAQVMATLTTIAVKVDGFKVDKDTGEAQVLFYLPERAFDELADLCVEHRERLTGLRAGTVKLKKGEAPLPADGVREVMGRRNDVINLFGRMLAELPGTNVDGAVQVAHAFTTHATDPQVDFFTAVDDLKADADQTGSGHMNSAEFSAGTFYRYASVNLDDLVANLDDRATAIELTAAFLSAFITAMPQAKKNSTAPFTVPDLAYITVRADRPVSLAAAFETPVRASWDSGYADASRQRLADYANRIHRLLGERGRIFHGHATIDDKGLEHLGDACPSFDSLITAAVDHVRTR